MPDNNQPDGDDQDSEQNVRVNDKDGTRSRGISPVKDDAENEADDDSQDEKESESDILSQRGGQSGLDGEGQNSDSETRLEGGLLGEEIDGPYPDNSGRRESNFTADTDDELATEDNELGNDAGDDGE